MVETGSANRKRNRGYEETHRALIATAVRMLSERGAEALSVSALAREMGLNRTTVYYHFPSRDAMLGAVKDWSSDQLTRGMGHDMPQLERVEHIVGFVLRNPELIKLWIDDFIAPGDVRERYPRWDELIESLRETFAAKSTTADADPEVYAIMMLTSAIIGPRVFQLSVAPNADPRNIARRFVAEQRRQLDRDGLLE